MSVLTNEYLYPLSQAPLFVWNMKSGTSSSFKYPGAGVLKNDIISDLYTGCLLYIFFYYDDFLRI